MYINESLANGLKERMWSECKDIDSGMKSQFNEYLRTHKTKYGSRTAFVKIDEMFRKGTRQKLLASVRSGTRASPVMFYALLGRGKYENREKWAEKVFKVAYVSIDSYGRMQNFSSAVKIGEHAMMRVFQRRSDIYDENSSDFDVFRVVSEFNAIGYLGLSMSFFFFHLSERLAAQNIPIKNLAVPFVSENGLFLGEYCASDKMIDIRTFIADHQMMPDQREWTEEVRAAIEAERNDYLPFVGILDEVHDHHRIKFFSKLCDAAPAFARLVAANEDDKETRVAIQQTAIKFFIMHRILEFTGDNYHGKSCQ